MGGHQTSRSFTRRALLGGSARPGAPTAPADRPGARHGEPVATLDAARAEVAGWRHRYGDEAGAGELARIFGLPGPRGV